MNKNELTALITRKRSFLCIGLDSAINKIPAHLMSGDDPVFEFNKAIIDATHDLAVAYKPNIAFYESRGTEGWKSLEKTIAYLKQFEGELFTIADAKRGDIGNTSGQYASAFLDRLGFDAITVAPYMGHDSVSPFLAYDNKWVILLALTSNAGSNDFQNLSSNGKQLFEHVLATSKQWGTDDQMMYVVGATRAEMLSKVREIIPEHFLLVPGVGAQGGSLEEVAAYGMTKKCGLLVNSSRGVIFASTGEDFAAVAREKASALQQEMESLLLAKGIIL
jgi:orotidine-5'-phosphate decarboxylase